MYLHITVHNLFLQEVIGFENRFIKNGGSHSSDRWLSFVGLVAQSALEYPIMKNRETPGLIKISFIDL
jgi:hypothetical protein